MFFLLISIFGILAALVHNHRAWKAKPWPKGALVVPLVQAHRGYWQHGAKENSLQSFSAAKKNGYQIFELDVRITADRQLVVFHDKNLTRLLGRDLQVHKLTCSELQEIADVPTLEQVLLSSERPPFINIELKNSLILDSTLEVEFAKLVQKTGVQNHILVSSFNPMTLRKLSSLLPEVPLALLATTDKEPGNYIFIRKLWLAPYLRIQALHLDQKMVTPIKISQYQKQGVPVALWTVNEKEKAQEFINSGAFSIISDVILPAELSAK